MNPDQRESSRRPLVLVGDSHLARFDIGRVAELERALGGRVVVHNHAIGGANSADLVERAPLEAACERALFVVSVGINDLALWKRIPLAQFAANAAALLDCLGGRRSIMVLPPPVDEARQGRLRGDQGRTNIQAAEYGRSLAAVSRAAGALVVDVTAALADKGDVHEPDGVHLNAEGYVVLIRGIIAAVAHSIGVGAPTTHSDG